MGQLNFDEIQDSNGVKLKTYAEVLLDKAKDAGFVAIVVLASKERKMLHTISNVDGPLPHLLIRVGNEMLKNQPPEPLESDIISPGGKQ